MDLEAVEVALRSGWLTTGPQVEAFEQAMATFCGAPHAVAVSSGTAALHAMMHAIGIGPGDEVIVPTMTFAATANCVVYQGGKPVFVDVEADTLLLDPAAVEAAVTPRTKAILTVDYAGQPCDYRVLREIANRHNLVLAADACHSLAAAYRGSPVGTLADLTAFSFHPVKNMTTGEGGMVVTGCEPWAARMRSFRNHGLSADFRQRQQSGTWTYHIEELGYNYRLTDLQSALGRSQLVKLPDWIRRRREIAAAYNAALPSCDRVRPLAVRPEVEHAYHLYVTRWQPASAGSDQRDVFEALTKRGIGVNVHFLPVHLHPFYQREFGTRPGLCPVAEAAYREILSLPMFPGLTDEQVARVIAAVEAVSSQQSSQAA